jgi:hypothetical protein
MGAGERRRVLPRGRRSISPRAADPSADVSRCGCLLAIPIGAIGGAPELALLALLLVATLVAEHLAARAPRAA